MPEKIPIKKIKWCGAFDSLKDIKENLAELECAFEARKPEEECDKWLVQINQEVRSLEMQLKKMRRHYEECKKTEHECRREKKNKGSAKACEEKDAGAGRSDEVKKPRKKKQGKSGNARLRSRI